MNAVVNWPETNRGCWTSADWNAMFDAGAADHERVERVAHPLDRAVAGLAVADELRDHRVVVHRDLAALVDAGVDAHDARDLGRRPVADEPPDRRQEVADRVLGVDPALDRPAVALDVLLRERQLLAGRDADHQLDEVETGDHLGHRVLDLQPRVHLEEVEVALPADDELDGARRLVVDGLGERDRLLAHRLARRVVEERRGRLLDHLLVPALDRALALVTGRRRCRGRRPAPGSRCGAAPR